MAADPGKKSSITPDRILLEAPLAIARAVADPNRAPESPPEERGWAMLDDRLSNLDREVPEGLADALRAGGVWCEYVAWDFYAHAWWEEGAFHAFVFSRRRWVGTPAAESLEALMTECSDRFGYD